jgi:hypothetical protein
LSVATFQTFSFHSIEGFQLDLETLVAAGGINSGRVQKVPSPGLVFCTKKP